ncbi:histidine kinase [Intrasporangium sp.]|uniref:sensor histidine kinase n=1 Tax=Intrasporangium sp. TaxID=1925024 RepID=UPI0033655FB0
MGETALGPSRWRAVVSWVETWFDVDSDWVRIPDDPKRIQRVDLIVALVFTLLASLAVELLRSLDSMGSQPVWLFHLLTAVGTLPLALRRKFPLVVAAYLSLHMLVVGLTVPAVMASMPMQVAYFFAIFTGVAWARDRHAMLLVCGGVLLVMSAWLVWQLAVSSGLESLLSRDGKPLPRQGLFSPVMAYAVYAVVVNIFFFGGAVIGGQAAWRAARSRDQLAEQAATIARQSAELQQQAVVAERLRIARELHDVVAHHVSVIGIQAAAARRVLTRDPAAAENALRSIETSSREGITQMRGLLGALRDTSDDDSCTSRAPEPRLADLGQLVESASTAGLRVTYDVVEDVPGSLAEVPGPVGLSLYRTAQEALANVRRHSTATTTTVVVRVDHRPAAGFASGFAEVEVVDNGRPRTGTSGSGLGLLGIRERLAAHGGVSEIGPRVTGGYRVRVRMPLSTGASAMTRMQR